MKAIFLKLINITILALFLLGFFINIANAQGLSPKLSHGWKRHIRSGKFFAFRREEFSSPTISSDAVYVGSSRGIVYAFKLKNGRTLWKWRAQARIESSPTVENGKLYIGDSEGYLNCLDAASGQLLWQYKNTAEIISKPVVQEGKVYFSTLDNIVVALNAESGQWIWHNKSPFSEMLNVRLNSSPVISGNWLYAGFTNGFIVALGADDGKEVWTRPLGQAGQLLLGVTTPVLVGDLLIAANYGRTLYALNRKTGEVNWIISGTGISKVATDGRLVYFTTLDGKLIAAELTSGYQIWEKQFEGPPLTAPIVDNDYIAMGDKEGRFFIIDAKTGEIVKKKNPWFDISGFSATPAFESGRLIFYSDHGRIYCKKAK